MVSAQFLCYKLQKMERTRKSTIRIFILSLFFGAGVEPCKIRPCHPFLFIANDKRCLRHVPIKVVMNFAAPGNQFLPKQIVGIAEPVYLRGTQIHIYLSIYLSNLTSSHLISPHLISSHLIDLSIYRPIDLSTYRSIDLSIYLSSVCLSVCLPACLPAWLAGWLSVCLSVCLSLSLSSVQTPKLSKSPCVMTPVAQ